MSRITVALVALIVVCATAQAHHSRAAFALDKSITLKVKVTSISWSNPHVFFTGEVVNAKGQAEPWEFESHSISGLVRQGWTKETLKVGDEVQMIVNPHRDGSKHFALLDHVVMANGTTMYSVGTAPQVANAVKPPVEPSKDFSGNWKYQFPGTPEEVRKRILLGPEKPNPDLPYTAKAQAQVKLYDAKHNPTLTCEPVSLPYVLMTVYEYKWIRSADKIVIQKEQLIDADRTLYLKTSTPPAGYKPNPMGFSTAKFEPDGTLVVETKNFSAVRWGNGAGVDSSDKKRIVERYQLINNGMGLSLSYTLEDPVYFSKPITGQGTFNKSYNSEFAQQPPCDVKAASEHLKFE